MTALSKVIVDEFKEMKLPYPNRLSYNLLVIDDDPDFRNIMEAVVLPDYVFVTAFAALRSMPSLRLLKKFDAVIMDYYLDDITGVEISQYISSLVPDLPVVLTSGGFLTDPTEKWPECVKGFVPKQVGPYRIVQEVMEIIDVLR